LFWNFNFADDPHSVFFAFLSNAGVVGLAGYLVVLGWSVWRGLRLSSSNLVGAAFLGSAVAYFTQALISIDEVSLRLAFWVGLAGLVASTEEAVPDPKPPRPGRKGRTRVRPPPVRGKPAVIVVALVTLGALWWSAMFLLADARVHQGGVLFARGEVERAKRQYELGLSFRGDYEYRRSFARDLAQAGITEPVDDHEFNRVMELLSFVDHFPQVDAIVERARAVAQRAAVEPELVATAAELYEEAFRRDSLNPVIRSEYARSLIAAEREDEAAALLEEFVAEMPQDQYSEFWGQLPLARALTGDSAAAREAIEIAFTLDPENAAAQRAQEVLE
jgi:tetratricopeptide (TPR) repeat protein